MSEAEEDVREGGLVGEEGREGWRIMVGRGGVECVCLWVGN